MGSDRLTIVVGKSHQWFERKEVSLTELSTTAWVMRESGKDGKIKMVVSSVPHSQTGKNFGMSTDRKGLCTESNQRI